MVPRKSARLKQPAKCGAAERVLIVSHVAGASLPRANTGSDTRPIRAKGTTTKHHGYRARVFCVCVCARRAARGYVVHHSVKISYVLAKLSLSYPKVVCGSGCCWETTNGRTAGRALQTESERRHHVPRKVAHLCVCVVRPRSFQFVFVPSQDKCDCIKQLSAVA